MRAVLTFCILALLTGCTPTETVFFAEGVTHSKREADLAQCRADAFAAYPVRTEIRRTPV